MSTARTVVRGLGEVLITLGVLVLLFAAYQLVYTNVQANRAAAAVGNDLEREWAVAPAGGASESDELDEVPAGAGFAFLHIPRLGDGWRRPVIQGVQPDELARGVGHYPESALPGEIGNFAVAGHRATHGEPFRDLNELQAGDAVVVETRANWYVYLVDTSDKVLPSEVGVVLPVPNQPGVEPTERLITLTTCDPRWGSTHRLIFWGHLDSVQPKSEGRPAVLDG